MKTSPIQCLLLFVAFLFTACPTTDPKKDSKKAAATPEGPTNEQAADIDFQAFVGRLRKAVSAHDANVVAEMMVPDFAFVLGATPAQDRQGQGVFQYWDENGLWVELEGILSERFVPKENYMVAPPQFADPSAEYTGYRAGLRRERGSWKFVYFVEGTGESQETPKP
jgi:hypothetical protein